jgi:NAD(P)-dependent dehydrogenase (short-subunit alcohol dehydrogenase family)
VQAAAACVGAPNQFSPPLHNRVAAGVDSPRRSDESFTILGHRSYANRGNFMIDFSGQVAVITGAGRGLGRLYALEFAKRGASVVVNDLGGSSRGEGADASVAGQVVKEIEAAGGKAISSHDDIGTPEGGQAVVQTALDKYGRVDVVVNNAGIYAMTPFEDITAEAWRQMINVHVHGSFYVSQTAYRAMQKQGYGRFVFISSSAGMFGQLGNSHYGTAKTALFGLSNVIALEGAQYGIQSNSVLPTGFSRMVTDTVGTDSDPLLNPFFKAIRPELITPLVVFLASRECKLTHQNFTSCAGRYARVFMGMGEGWFAPPGTTPTADDIAVNVAAITATDPYIVPGGLFDEIADTCSRLGVDLRAPA